MLASIRRLVWVAVAVGVTACSATSLERDVSVADASVEDASAEDAPSLEPDANEGPPCDCNDGLLCTRDSCDAFGECVHEPLCAAGHSCFGATSDYPSGCFGASGCSNDNECHDAPCAPSLGCRGGYCRYEWNTDRDEDGVLDGYCGGTDCDPLNPNIPGAEICNLRDDDCDGTIDETFDLAHIDCDACLGYCAATDGCGADGCFCRGPGRLSCPQPDHTFACVDSLTDVLNCGACGHECLEGSTCDAGLCRHRPEWLTGVDLGLTTYLLPAAAFGPTGDVVIPLTERPTRLFHGDGRAPETLPDSLSRGATALHLDGDGELIDLVSIPRVSGYHVTALGYFATGTADVAFDVAGTRVERMQTYVAYVPRGASEVAWVRVFEGPTYDLVTNAAGGLILHGVGRSEFFRITPEGVVSEPFHFSDAFGYRWARLYPVSDGGFLAIGGAPGSMIGTVPIAGPPFGQTAVLHDDAGNVLSAVRHAVGGLLSEPANPLCIRADGLARLVVYSFALCELLAGGEIRRLSVGGGRPIYDGVGGMVFDQGFAVHTRDEVVLDRFLPPPWVAHGTSIWAVSPDDPSRFRGGAAFTLPDAMATVSRMEWPEVL